MTGAKSITCPRCRRTSWSPGDIANRYCGYCHAFHDELHLLPPLEPDDDDDDERPLPKWLAAVLLVLLLIGIALVAVLDV